LIELDLIHDEVGITFIFITHDQQEALSISDRIAVMNAGKILQVGTPAEVYEAPADTFVADFLGENNFFSGKVTGIINEELAKIDLEGIGEIVIEQDKKVQIGDKVTVSLRPEKIRLSKNEITKSKVRRERMGHIKLATPIAHIWYSKGTPNKMSLLLGISTKELESVLYFSRYIVTDPGETGLQKGEILTEREYKLYENQFKNEFTAIKK